MIFFVQAILGAMTEWNTVESSIFTYSSLSLGEKSPAPNDGQNAILFESSIKDNTLAQNHYWIQNFRNTARRD